MGWSDLAQKNRVHTAATMTDPEKLKALRQIQSALCRADNPTLRACGLDEVDAQAVCNEGLIEVRIVADDGSLLDRYRVQEISELGHGILSRSDASDALRVTLEPKHRSAWARLGSAFGSKLWDVVKVAIGALIGWLLKTYFGSP